MPKFRKKPVVIEAVQLTQEGFATARDFIPQAEFVGGGAGPDGKAYLKIGTLEGVMRADEGDWIIRGIQGEHYPCKPDIFEATYEPVGAAGDGTLSAWSLVFKLHEDAPGPIHVGVEMDDNSYLSGQLFSFSNNPDGTPGRELVLSRPVKMRDAKGDESELGAQFVIVAEHRIKRIDVTHLQP